MNAGPQVDDDTFEKVLQYIEYGKKEGATLAAGGKRVGDIGYFIQPTVFTDVTDNMSIAKDEVIIITYRIYKAEFACVSRQANTSILIGIFLFFLLSTFSPPPPAIHIRSLDQCNRF